MMTLPTALQPLASAPRWVGWRWVEKPNGDLDKPPFRADFPDFHASTQDPKSWTHFGAAVASLAAGKVHGVGYVCRDDPEHAFIDLDECRDPDTGDIADWAMRVVEECNSYTEITPSKRGLRVIGTGGSLAHPIHTPYKLQGGGSGELFFRAARYVTVSGERLPGTPDKLADISDVMLDMLVQAGRAKASKEGKPASEHVPNPKADAPIEDVRAALALIPNPGRDVHYDDWVRTGIATFGASSGSQEGFEAWVEWSRKSEKFDLAGCEKVWTSIQRSPPRKIGFGALYYLAKSQDDEWRPPSWRERPEFGGVPPEGPTGQDAPPPAPLPLIYFDDVAPNLDAADFVEGLLTIGAMSVVYGPSNCGKTFWATDLGLHVATGRRWRGREIEPGGVIYCALEGSHGISNRVAAFKKAHGLEGVEVPFAIIPVSINMLDPAADRDKLAQTIRVAAEAMGVPVKLTVIDTLSRAMAGGNENAPDDMGALVTNADYVRQLIQTHLMWIHHSGKDQAQGARGHSLLRAATDTEIEINREDPDSPSVAKVTKQREMEIEGEFVFRLKAVDLGTNRRGKPVTSCVVDPVEGDSRDTTGHLPGQGQKSRLSGDQQIAMRVLRDALAEAGERGFPGVPGDRLSIPEQWWRERFYQRAKAGAAQDAKKRAFRRAADALAAVGLVALDRGRVWEC